MVTALSIRDDHSSTSGRYTLTDEEDDRVDLKLNPVAGRRWVDPRARWVAASLAPHLHADSPEHARDILTATVLCECSYKSPESHVRERVAELSREFPPFAVRLSGVSASVEGRARRRYLVARAPGVTYVAFTGTREAMDFLADASFLQTPLAEGLGLGSDVKSSAGGRPMVHRGFAARAREVRAHVRAAWRRARERGDRFVLCGHSLGGAVATLAAVAILAEADDDESRSAAAEALRCVAFASPPVGNSAWRRAVWERGWGPAFTNVCVPEDPVPRLLFTPRQRATVDAPRQPPTRDTSREANAARRLPRLVPMTQRRSDETQGPDGAPGSTGKSSYLRAAGRAIRPEYVHLGPIHHLLRGGRIVSSDAHTISDDEGVAGAAGGDVAATTDETREGGPGAIAAVRHAVLRHTMRTYRARMVELCDGAVGAKPGSHPRRPPSSTGTLPRPVGTAIDAAPNPRPMIAVAVVSVGEDGASFATSTYIRGSDLDLCDVKAGVKAEVRGWPCVVAHTSPMCSPSELAVRVSAPSFNGEKLPDADAGGPSVFGWAPMILSCGGDFGDARVGVRVTPRRVWVTAGDDVDVDDVTDVTDAFRETDGGWIDFRSVVSVERQSRWSIRRLLGSLGGAPDRSPAPGDVFVVVTAGDVAEDGATVRVTPGTNVRDARRALLGALRRTERDALAHAADALFDDPRRRKSPFRQGFAFGAAAAAGAAFGAALRRDFEGEG